MKINKTNEAEIILAQCLASYYCKAISENVKRGLRAKKAREQKEKLSTK